MENITQEQRDLLAELQTVDAAVTVHWDEVRGVASSIRGKMGMDAVPAPGERLDAFLKQYGALLGPPDLPEGLRLLRRKQDDLDWEHLVFQYMVAGETEVYGAKLAAHFDADGVLVEVQSSLWRDIQVDAEPEIEPGQLRDILLTRIQGVQGFDRIRDTAAVDAESDFPMTDPPRLVVYPWEGEFRPTWITYGYSDLDELEGRPVDVPYITYGQIFVDATTGERILFAPTLHSAETADTGSGLAVTPLTGTHTTRALNIVRVDTSSTYRLKDTTHKRDIVTYDTSCSTSYNSGSEIRAAITGGTLPVSADTDGDKNWNRLPTSTASAQRTSGQQPEVDAHFFARQQYEWYDALAGGRDGWDDGNYPNPPVPPQAISVIAHCYPPPSWVINWGSTCSDVNAYQSRAKSGGVWTFWLAFMDGDGTTFDYPAGSHFIFAHEYQHAITNFSFEDGAHDPGLAYSGWLGAVHEGLSDVFGVLSSEQWLPATDISHATPRQAFRNIVYPRDTAAFDPNKLDHFADRNVRTDFYERGTILAHCAYLMGKGGVHQRAARTPMLIPVYGLGRQTVGGKSVLKAARIWYRALTHYFSTHGTLTGIPANDENTFRTLRNACVSAAADRYGNGSAEHRNTILAFYAVGLHPDEYGADVTFLRWGVSWHLSRSYIGLTSPNYSSLDLFINNGGSSEWNALVNVVDPSSGQPTEYENAVYCRVRNVGDTAAQDVQVEFHYAKAGTATWNWLPVKDKNGNVQKLNIGTLAAGQSNFPDSAQNSPPASASVKWCIPPLAPAETVDHFCLRARVTSTNDVNSHNNEVQSNVAYSAYSPPAPARTAFVAGNPYREEDIPLELKLEANLPKGWKAYLKGVTHGELLEPGEERLFSVVIEMPSGADKALAPPLDGDVYGEMYGDLGGAFTGSLTDTVLVGHDLKGRFAAQVKGLGAVCGLFEGTIDLGTAEMAGRVVGPHPEEPAVELFVDIKGCLRPWRRVDVSQWHDRELVGGVTVQVQVPWEGGPCAYKLPPTDTRVTVPRREGFVIVTRKDLLQRYHVAGDLLAEWSVAPTVHSFAVGPEGEIYVTAIEEPLVLKFSPDGELMADWLVEGGPTGIAVSPEGEVLVTVTRENVVLRYSPDGELLAEWSVEGGPSCIAVNPEGEVFVATDQGRVVVRHSPDGEPLADWHVEAGVIETNGIVVGVDDHVFVATPELALRYSPDGEALAKWPVEGEPNSIMPGPEGEIVVAVDDSRWVLVYSPEGQLLNDWETRLD
jgi:Zn-dependent metalloprotease